MTIIQQFILCRFALYTTAQRNAIVNRPVGIVLQNTDVGEVQFWDGEEWIALGPNTVHDTAPTANDDASVGYGIGSAWIDTTADKAYVCLDNTDGAAVWHRINTPDATDVTYTPAVATDWDGDADPGNADDALDQLAERTDDLEAATVAILSERATQAVAADTTIAVTDGTPITPFTTTGNITNTAAPFIAAGREGQLVILRNDNGSGTLTLSDTNIGVGGSLLRLSANTVTMAAGSSMALTYSTIQAAWVEQCYLALVAVTPSINSHTINIGAGASNAQNAEVANAGTDTPTFAWTFTGVPTSGTVDVSAGGDPATDYPATILTPFTSLVGPAFNKGTSVGTVRTFTPSIVVNGVTKTTPTATVTYINRRYMGPSDEEDTLSSAQVLGLDATAAGQSELSTIRTGTFNDIDTAAGEYIWFAYRAALGAGIYFTIEGEIAAFTEKQTTLSHTNDSGFVEDFRTWRSDNSNFGANKDVVVATSAGTNRFYMGPSTDEDPISNANILALDDTADGESGLYSSQARTWSAIKIEAGEYLWYCHPDRIADLATIKDGTTGFAIAGSYRTNVSHTNQYGYVEDYRCWRSDNTGIYPSGENIVVT